MLKKLSITALAAGFAVLAGAVALAANKVIDDAKAQCTIGEQIDGYLGAVQGATPDADVQREMRSVNQQRKQVYVSLAQRNGVTPDVTAKLTAEKLINREPSGNCVQDAAGKWVKKP